MAIVPNLGNPGMVDKPYLTPNRKVAALPVPLYAGEIVLNTTDGKSYTWAATDWTVYAYGLGLN